MNKMSSDLECNICGGTEFGIKGTRPVARCLQCDSLERTRLLWMYLERMDIKKSTRVLHLAPDRCIYTHLSKRVAPSNYVTADFDPRLYNSFAPETKEIDLCHMEAWESDQFDLILHCHVMEHIPCTIAYPLFHLQRILTPTGRHMFIVPFLRGAWGECFQDIGNDERTRRFGQYDHVRMFGRDDAHMHLGKIVPLPTDYDATREFSEAAMVKANIPLTMAKGLTTATVIDIGKNDLFATTPATRQ